MYRTKFLNHKGTKEQRNKGTKEQRNKGTKEQKLKTKASVSFVVQFGLYS